MENETKAIKNKIDEVTQQIKSEIRSAITKIDENNDKVNILTNTIDEVTQQNKSEIRSVITKMDENNDKVNILTNTIINLQATVENL